MDRSAIIGIIISIIGIVLMVLIVHRENVQEAIASWLHLLKSWARRLVPRPDGDAPFWDQDQGRRRGRSALTGSFALLLMAFAAREALPGGEIEPTMLGQLLYTTSWLVYDPSDKELDLSRQPVYPGLSSIEKDLRLIALAGFTGIVTSNSDGIMEDVPRVARRNGLRVIMGIWNPADRGELACAIRQRRHVDAYCVGHDGVADRYSLAQLESAIRLVRRRTHKPVATSEWAIHYDDRLLALGDWLFPDVHLTLKDSERERIVRSDLDRDIELFRNATTRMVEHARTRNCPLMVKNVVYPYAGVEGASRSVQSEFFRRVFEWLNDPQQGPNAKVAVASQGAFDAPWKTQRPFLSWDPFTGLLSLNSSSDIVKASPGEPDVDCHLSPAAREILRWYPDSHVTHRTN